MKGLSTPMFSRARFPRRRFAAIGALIVVVGGVACSAASSFVQPSPTTAPAPAAQSRSADSMAKPAALPAPASIGGAPAVIAAAQPGNASAPAQDATVADTSAQILNRMVIRTAQLQVEVQDNDIEKAIGQVRAIASRGGGFVSAANTHFEKVNDQDRMLADLTLQVRSDIVDATMSDLRALGKVTSENSGSQDVTDEYVDLDSNLRNLQASETAILKLMDKATQIQDVVSLQRELTNIRGQIERIQGRKSYLEHRTDMATITIALRLPPVPSTQPASGAWDPGAVAQRGWQASLTLLRGVAEAIIIAAAFSWWLLPLVAVAAYVLLQRRRTPQSPPPAETAA